MNKEEAAEALGLSRRTLQRRISRGKIAYTLVPTPRGEEAAFDPKEVERVKAAEREGARSATVAPALSPMPSPVTDGLARQAPRHESLGRFAELQELAELLRPAQAPTVSPVPPKLLLPVGEAVDCTGAGESAIEAAIRSGALKARKAGPRGARVIKRSDLEAWVRKL